MTSWRGNNRENNEKDTPIRKPWNGIFKAKEGKGKPKNEMRRLKKDGRERREDKRITN